MADATTAPAAEAAPAAPPARASKAAAAPAAPAAEPTAPEAPAYSGWYPISAALPAGAYLDNVTGRRVTLVGGEVRQVRFAASVDIAALSAPMAGPADAIALVNEYGRRRCEIRYQAIAPAAASPEADAPATPAASA